MSLRYRFIILPQNKHKKIFLEMGIELTLIFYLEDSDDTTECGY